MTKRLKATTASQEGKAEPALVPASTVVEAQNSGEQARFRDDAMWALEGLAPTAAATTIHESLAMLVEVGTHRRGRLALRSSGLPDRLFSALAALSFTDDAVSSLGAATLLLTFCQADADAGLTASDAFSRLALALLGVRAQVSPSQCGVKTLAARIMKPLQEVPFARAVPREASYSPLSVTLAALSGLLSPFTAGADTEPVKHALRRHGVLAAVARVAVEQAGALTDPSPTLETVQSLWRLHRALAVLETSCFACPVNEGYLVGVTVQEGLAPLVKTLTFIQWITQRLGALSAQGLGPGLKKDCLRSFLAVLMNLTQNNDDGCAALAASGALATLPDLLSELVQGGTGRRGCMDDRDELEMWVDELSGCLGVLINLVEHQPATRAVLRSCRCTVKLPGGTDRLIPLLCRIMSVVLLSEEDAATKALPAAGTGTKEVGRDAQGEVTLDSLEEDELQGAGLIVEVYAAILLGFLIEGEPAAQAEAAGLLPGGSLEPVVAAVARCLQFYVRAGAITRKTEDALRALLVSLKGSG